MENHMKIIAFTGMPVSGKTEAVQLAREKGIPVIRMGDLVWEETKRQGKPLDDKHVGTIATTMRERNGMDVWAKRTVEKIRSMNNPPHLVIDGVRNMEEIEYFKKELGLNFFVIAIVTRDELRRKRMLARGRSDDSKDSKIVEERDQRERQWGLQNVIAKADIRISNNGSLAEFRKHVLDVLNKLQGTIL
jgi:dephospho-CoA kinase